MKTLQALVPRQAVLEGTADFVVNLADLPSLTEPEAREFLESNVLTSGMELLLQLSFARMAGEKSASGIYKLSESMGGGKTQSMIVAGNVNDDIEIRRKLSIEHVMPQEWESHWSLREASDDAVEHRELMLQTFGNLTLVTPEFNTKLSNRDFKTKKREITRTSRLLLNRRFWAGELQDWDEVTIRIRSRELFDLARQRWPHPTSPAALESLALDLPPDKSGRVSDDEDVINEPPIEPGVAESLLEDFARARNAEPQSASD